MSLDVVAALGEAAARAWPHEMVGLLLGRAGSPEVYTPLKNRAPRPEARFEADPGDAVKALLDASRQGLDLIALVHSHPVAAGRASTRPSARDLGHFVVDGQELWPGVALVVVGVGPEGAQEVAAWRWSVEAGTLVAADLLAQTGCAPVLPSSDACEDDAGHPPGSRRSPSRPPALPHRL